MSGPKTTKGKARSRMNAFKHGLRATDELFLAHLEPHERRVLEDLRARLHEEYHPQTTHEKLLMDQIIIQNLRLYRLYDLEYRAATLSWADPLGNKSIFFHLDRLSRYDERILRQLRALQNRLRTLYCRREDYSLNSFSPRE
jgi:hypothetical protein